MCRQIYRAQRYFTSLSHLQRQQAPETFENVI